VRPGMRMRRVCTDTLVHTSKRSGNEQPGRGGGRDECVRPHRYTRATSHGTSHQAGEEDAASVYGYTCTLQANSHGTSGLAREQDATIVYGYTGILVHMYTRAYSECTPSGQAREEDATHVHGHTV
jgi:hypothetical protein